VIGEQQTSWRIGHGWLVTSSEEASSSFLTLRVRSSSGVFQSPEGQAAVMETELPLEFVNSEPTIVPLPFQHTGSGKAALTQFPFQFWTRFYAIAKSYAACGHARHKA
jgi:hypothetical protein